MFGKTRHIHFVGIGGIGMSGMAELLHKLGFSLSGSDLNKSERTSHLESLGIDIFQGHQKENVNECDVLVYSSAVNPENPEIVWAKTNGVPVIRRAEMLSELMKLKDTSIAVAGTHGKTTTSSMLGNILLEAELQPTLVIGGIVNKFNTNTISGDGEIIVVEADEFDKTFLQLSPTHAVINNLDLEHLDCYENLEDLQSSFIQFANAVPFYGRVCICIDHENTKSIIPKIKRPILTFGFDNDAEVRAENISYDKMSSSFDLKWNGSSISNVRLNVPGAHNIQNALAAITVALELEVDIDTIINGLALYTGVRRRFQIVKSLQDGTLIIDDYAHHPAEVEATLNSAKSGWNKRIISIFQPHLYSRTRDFYQDFATAFKMSDIAVFTDIFPAREEPIEGISTHLIVNELSRLGHDNIHYIEDIDNIPDTIHTLHQPGDIILTMGAGNIWRQNDHITAQLSL